MDLQLALKWFELSKIDDLDLVSLKKKYRKLTLKYHPDKGGKTTDFVQLQAAYNFLQDCIKYPNSHKSNFQNNTTDIEFYKQQIEKLQKSNLNYQNRFDSQVVIINEFYKQLDQINFQSDEYNFNLSKLLDEELLKLDKKYKSSWWKGAVGMKSMSRNDLVYYQNQLINEHNDLLVKSQKENLDANYKSYQKVVDQIVKGLNRF
jgi:DnaJ domain